MIIKKDKFFVLTGGPGSGKSSLVEALMRRGVRCIPEAGREIIKEQVRVGGSALPWNDPRRFRDLMLSCDLQAYCDNQERSELVIFDRELSMC